MNDAEERVASKVVLTEFKESTPCSDCRQLFPHYVMEFDHTGVPPRTSTGKRKPSILGHYAPITFERIVEIMRREDLELVCANCHCIRTHQRKEAHGA